MMMKNLFPLLSLIFGGLQVYAQDVLQKIDNTETSEKVSWDLPTVNQHFQGSINYMTKMKCTLHCAPTVDCATFSHVKEPGKPQAPVPNEPTKDGTTSGTPAVSASGAPNTAKSVLRCPNPLSHTLDIRYNLPDHKSAAQSSTWQEDSVKHGAQNAIDGNIGTITITAGYSVDPHPWWRIDMHKPHIITGFSIRNRAVHEPWRLHDFEVRVGDVDPVSTPRNLSGNLLCFFHPDGGVASAAVFSRHCTEPLKGQYLSIQIMKLCNGCGEPNNNFLVLSEVYVYGCKP